MDKLQVTIIQSDIQWENVRANLDRYDEMITHSGETDLLIFPEMFTTGFSMNPERLKEPMDGPSVKWMKKLAQEKNACVTGSLIINDNNSIFNRAVWVFPDGELLTYDKRHLFTMGEENRHYVSGEKRLIVDFRGWRFFPLICYDLRFPVWSRNTENYDVLLYMANWPSSRHLVWKNLLVARAIENQAYCLGVNRTGTDGNGISYHGDSAMVTPRGHAEFFGIGEKVQTFTLDYSSLHNFRRVFPVLNDRDEFQIK